MFDKRVLFLIIFIITAGLGCAKNDDSMDDESSLPYGFQDNSNKNANDNFEITSIMQDNGVLEEIYNDIDGMKFSDELEEVVDSNLDAFINVLEITAELLTDHSDLIIRLLNTEAKGILEWLIDKDASPEAKLYDYESVTYDAINAFYAPDQESVYTNQFYSFLDDLSDKNEEGVRATIKEVSRMGATICRYILDTKDKDELRDDIQEAIDDELVASFKNYTST